jgi:hypothetical protein
MHMPCQLLTADHLVHRTAVANQMKIVGREICQAAAVECA